MGSQGDQQDQRMLPGLFESLHGWKALKKAHVCGDTSILLYATAVW
jgi:hypothetical protein